MDERLRNEVRNTLIWYERAERGYVQRMPDKWRPLDVREVLEHFEVDEEAIARGDDPPAPGFVPRPGDEVEQWLRSAAKKAVGQVGAEGALAALLIEYIDHAAAGVPLSEKVGR